MHSTRHNSINHIIQVVYVLIWWQWAVACWQSGVQNRDSTCRWNVATQSQLFVSKPWRNIYRRRDLVTTVKNSLNCLRHRLNICWQNYYVQPEHTEYSVATTGVEYIKDNNRSHTRLTVSTRTTTHYIGLLRITASYINNNYTGQQIFNIALLPGKILVNLIDPFNVHTNIISDLLDHVGISRNMNWTFIGHNVFNGKLFLIWYIRWA